jgi:hypothetical protein
MSQAASRRLRFPCNTQESALTRTAKLTAGAAAVAVIIAMFYRAGLPGQGAPASRPDAGTQPAQKTAAVQPASAAPGWFGDVTGHRFAQDEFDSMKPTAQELKNPYTRAALYQECATYLETRGHLADDIAGANQVDPSGKAAEFVTWMAERHDARCEGVSPSDVKRIDELMAQAAKAGEPGAQRYMLDKDLQALEKSAKTGGPDGASVKQQAAAMLSQAGELVKRGDLPSAEIAARLTASDRYGQGDKVASAAWMMVAVQESAQPFSTRHLGQDQPSFASLSPAEYDQALQRAQAMHANCCSYKRHM